MIPPNEKKLVDRARRGSEDAFEELVRRNEKLVYSTALKISGNPEDALDISQETFINAFRGLKNFRGDCAFSVWLSRLCYNAAMDYLKKRSDTVLFDSDDGAELYIADESPSPEEIAERNDTRRAVRRAVLSLPDDRREIIIMRDFAGMAYSDIADALRISEGTVRSRIYRARAALREIILRSGTFSGEEPSNNKEKK